MSKQGAERFGQYLSEFLAHSSFPNASAFAAAAGVSPSAVSRWMRGKERPAAEALPKIAPLMGVSAVQLFAIAYPEETEDTGPIPAPESDVPPEIRKSTLLTKEQQDIVAGVIAGFLAANENRPPRRRKAVGDTTRTGDDRKAI